MLRNICLTNPRLVELERKYYPGDFARSYDEAIARHYAHREALHLQQLGYDLEDHALQAPACGSIEQRYDDKHGLTVVSLANIRYDSESHRPIFDLHYAHAEDGEMLPPARSLSDALPNDAAFGHTTAPASFRVVSYKGRRVVSIDPVAMKRRNGLAMLAHELGHLTQRPVVTSVIRSVAGLALTHQEQDALRPYDTAITMFAESHNSDTQLRDAIADLPIGDGESEDLTAQQLESVDDLCGAYRYHSATLPLRAIKEAIAWRHAATMIAEGALHTGMSQTQLKNMALRSTAAYDKHYNASIFRHTTARVLDLLS